MKNSQRSFAIPIIIAVVVLLVIGSVYIYTNSKVQAPELEEKTKLGNKEKVEQLLAQKFDEPINKTKLTIQKENDSYIVGQTGFGEGGILVMAAKVNDNCVLAYTGNAIVDCNELRNVYNFPVEFLPEYCTDLK